MKHLLPCILSFLVGVAATTLGAYLQSTPAAAAIGVVSFFVVRRLARLGGAK